MTAQKNKTAVNMSSPQKESSSNLKIIKSSQFLSILFSIFLLVIAVNILLSLPTVVSMSQATVASVNVPGNETEEISLNQAEQLKEVIEVPKSQGLNPPTVSATAIVIKDIASGEILFAKNADKRVPIASTTKIMTALVGAEVFKPNDVLEVKDLSAAGGSTMGLQVGEQLSFRSLLYGMLLNSGNDAAYTIAQNHPGGTESFINLMNQKATSFGLNNTHFDNPAGFDSPNHYSSAFDLSVIASRVSEDGHLARIYGTKETTVASLDKTNVHKLKNLNKLLADPEVLGMKTGTTPQARENLVTLVERDNNRVIMVILGSDDRFGETEKLKSWTYSNFIWD